MAACKEHAETPVVGYSACAGCEVERLKSDYARLEQECERLRLDNLSKNGSIKALGAQIAALQRAVKNRDKLKARAESERDAALKLLAKCQEKLDPHRDAVLWGEVCDAFKAKP